MAVAGDEIFLDETLVDVYAYYPYDLELGIAPDKTNVSNYLFTIPSDQTVSGPEIDFLWAKTEAVSLTNNRANMQFRHLLSRMVINLSYDTGATNEVSDVQIHNVYTSCRIDLRTGMTTPTGTIVPVKPYLYDTPETDSDLSYEAIVIPHMLTAGSPVVSLLYNGQRLLYEIPVEQPLLSGSTYTLNLRIGSAQPETAVVSQSNLYLKRISYEY